MDNRHFGYKQQFLRTTLGLRMPVIWPGQRAGGVCVCVCGLVCTGKCVALRLQRHSERLRRLGRRRRSRSSLLLFSFRSGRNSALSVFCGLRELQLLLSQSALFVFFFAFLLFACVFLPATNSQECASVSSERRRRTRRSSKHRARFVTWCCKRRQCLLMWWSLHLSKVPCFCLRGKPTLLLLLLPPLTSSRLCLCCCCCCCIVARSLLC